jgi:hypothetical protein
MIAHPCLFLNDHRVEVAKYNIAHHAWAAGIYHQVKLDGDRLAKMELPKFETAWWQEAKKKRWQDIYPENMRHTYYVPRTAKLDGSWQAEWRQGDVRFRLTMLGVPGTEVTLCDFPRNDKFEPPPTPMLIVRRMGKSACFVALYQAEKHDLPPAEISVVEEAARLLVKVFLAGRIREHPVPVLP